MSLLGDGQKRPYASTPFDKASGSKQSKPSPGGGLNQQQQHALELALSGTSIFLTGGAGTGKSFTLRRIIKALQGRYGEESVMITASTGIAACHIGGTTVHSFAGVGLAKEKLSELEAKVKKNRTCSRRWQECRVLVVDEVSMLDGGLFDKLEQLARKVRKSDEPFGGLQLVLCGDFFQLPPIGLSQNTNLKFLFEAEAWPRVVRRTVLLGVVFRQSDSSFVALLNEMRRARLTPFSVALLRGAVANPPALGPSTTKLFAHNEPADRENERRLLELQAAPREYVALDDENKPLARTLRENCIAPTALQLRVGARVMMLKNKEVDGIHLFNGMCGDVIGFEVRAVGTAGNIRRAPRPQQRSSGLLASSAAAPIIGGGAEAAPARDDPFGDGRPSLFGGPDPAMADQFGDQFADQFGDGGDGGGGGGGGGAARAGEAAYVTAARLARQPPPPMVAGDPNPAPAAEFEWPVVQFAPPIPGGEPIVRTIVPEEWKLEQGGVTVASRAQVPLKLAWAISIHKSQGMTLETAELDLARCFDEGHAYVALSRAVSLRQTRLASFDPSKVRANKRVAAFYDALEAEQEQQRGGAAAGGGAAARAGGGVQPLRERANCVGAPGASSAPGGLSREQLALIEEKKKQALARRRNAQYS